jgi:uncharacterized ParB-like nuclease family protein
LEGNSMTDILLSAVRTDGGTQSRAAMSPAVVDEYAAKLGDGATFPAIVVFYDGDTYWLADGFHRHAAHVKAGREEIGADVREGGQREAIQYSLGANETHGLRRTRADKRKAVGDGACRF